jgi:hypothetical protein
LNIVPLERSHAEALIEFFGQLPDGDLTFIKEDVTPDAVQSRSSADQQCAGRRDGRGVRPRRHARQQRGRRNSRAGHPGDTRAVPGGDRAEPQRLLLDAQACGRVMQPGSSITNISSALALTTAGLPQTAYAFSKAALIGLTRDLAQQWTPRKASASTRWRPRTT